MRRPVRGPYRVTLPWGVRGRQWSCGHHTGLDIAAPRGSKVVSTVRGTVHYIGRNVEAPYGLHVVVVDEKGRWHMFCHLSRRNRFLRVGSRVWIGRHLGRVGMTGNATGPHLHYEVREAPHTYGTTDVNPKGWVK